MLVILYGIGLAFVELWNLLINTPILTVPVLLAGVWKITEVCVWICGHFRIVIKR